MASSEMGAFVQSELQSLNIDTDPEVHAFRIPGERRPEVNTPTAGNMNTVLTNIQASREKVWVSRKRVRHDALRLLREEAL